MATGSFEIQSMECPVCHEYYHQPKILPCAHLLCRSCLVSWMEKKEDALCPLCRSAILEREDKSSRNCEDIVDSLLTDHAMSAMVESVKILNEQRVCHVHRSVGATSLCLHCNLKLCQSCVEVHKNLPLTSFHKVEDLGTITLESLASNRHEPCSYHPDKTSELFCIAHNVLICTLCATSKHRTCPEVTCLKEVYEKYKQTLSDIKVRLTATVSGLNRAITQIEEHLSASNENTQAAFKQIDATCNALLDSVEICRKRLNKLVQDADDIIKATALEQKSSVAKRRGTLTSHLYLIERLQNTSSGSSLVAMVPKLENRIAKLDLDAPLPTGTGQGFQMVRLTIDRQTVVNIEQALEKIGELSLSPPSLLRDIFTATYGQPATKTSADAKNISKIPATSRSQLDNSSSLTRTDILQCRPHDCCRERLDEFVGSTRLHLENPPFASQNVSTLNKTKEASSGPLPPDEDDWNMTSSREELKNGNNVCARRHEKIQTISGQTDLSANSAAVCALASPEAHSPSLGSLPLISTELASHTATNRTGTDISQTAFINHQDLMQASNETTQENKKMENFTCNSKQQDELFSKQCDMHETNAYSLHSENLNISLGKKEVQKVILHPLAAELLLKCEAVKQDLVQQAMLHGILINFDGLFHAYHFISFQNGSSEMVCSLIDCVLKLEIIPLDSAMSKYSNLLSLTKQYPSQFLCKYGETNQILSVAFHKKIEPEVNAIIHKLKTLKQLTFTLPLYAINYIKHNFHKVIQLIKENVRFPVHVEIHADQLVVLFDKYHSTEDIQRTVCILLGNLQLTEVEVESTVAEYLQESGQKYLKLLNMKFSDVHVSVPLPEPELLARSPTQQQLFMCKSSVAVLLCQVLVLPSYDSKWNNQPVSLLEDFLYTSIQGCSAEMKSTPRPYLFSLPHSEHAQDKTVVVMPALKENNTENKCIRTTLEEVLRSLPTDATIALPIKMSEDIPMQKSLKIMLPVLKLHMEQKENCNTIILYLDGESDINIKDIIEHYLFNTNSPDWIRGIDLSCKQCNRMKVIFGELHTMQADILVNSTDIYLKHTQAQASKRLLQEAGEQLENQGKYLYPNGIENNLVVITDSFNLKNVKEIFHIVLRQEKWTAETGEKMLDYLRTRVQACLLMASAKKYKSIAFPALGTGTLDYPADKVAKTMILTINNFFRKMPQSSLQDVFVVCFPYSMATAKAFKAEETAHTFWQLSDDKSKKFCSEARLEVKNTLVQIIVGNARQQQGVAEIILVGDPPVEGSLEEYRNCTPAKTTFFPITRRPLKVQEEIRKAFDNAKSVQINISSFGVQCYKDIMISVTKACYELHDSLLNIIIIVPTVKDLQILVAKCHKYAEKQKSKFSSLFSKEKAPMPFTRSIELMDGSQREKPTVEICGFGRYIDVAVIMIKEIKVPTLHQRSMIQEVDGSPVKSLTTSKLSDERAPLTNMQASLDPYLASLCTVSIPCELLKEGDEEVYLKNPLFCSSDVHISKQRNNIVLWVKFDSLVKIVSAVYEQTTNLTAVRESENKSQNQITNLTAVKTSENKSQNQKTHGAFTTEISSLEYEAVKQLMPQELKQDYRKVNEAGEKVTITFDSQHKMEMFKEKYNYIRKEEITLTQDEIVCLEKSTDFILEDVEAFAKLLPLESKVVIICFDYNAMAKAKLLVNVKAGRIKVTQRNKRRFEGGTKESDEMVDHQASLSATGLTDPNSVHSHVKQKDFTTKSGIRVSVYKAQITKLTVDAIVNAANGDLQHVGGVAAAIAIAAGPELELEGDEYVKTHGPLQVTQVIATKAGNLPCQKVLHAVGPRWIEYTDKEECQHALEKTVFNSLEKAHSLKFSSLALSSISSAIFAVPKAICARMYLAAVQRFEQQLGISTTLKHIHFVDISDEMVGIIQDIFTDHWNTTVLTPNILPSLTNIKRPAMKTGLSLPYKGDR